MEKVSDFIDSLGDELKENILKEMDNQGCMNLSKINISEFGFGYVEIAGLFDFYKSEKGAAYWWPINDDSKIKKL